MRLLRVVLNRWVGCALLILWGSVLACGELVYFVPGGRVQVAAEPAGDQFLRLEIPGAAVTVARAEVRKLVPGHWPEREWPARRAAASAAGRDGQLAAAWWALEQGLTREAEEYLRTLRSSGPVHPAVSRMLAALDRLEPPAVEPERDAIDRALGGTFRVARSPHILLLHQHSEDEAADRLELLEAVVRSFYLLFAAQGLELPVPRQRLVAAWFADQRDYLAFLHAEGADAFRGTMGYYHPTLRAVVTYDTRSLTSQRALVESLAAREQAIGLLPEGERRARLERDLARRRLLGEVERRALEIGTAAHEIVHLLVATSHLAPRQDDFPLWLHEGLAAQFEVVRGGRWAGFGRANDLRLPDWRKIDPPPRLVPLVRDAGFGHGYNRNAYAAAWALVYYLRHEHPSQFIALLDLLRIPDAEIRPRADRTVALFQQAFGADIHALEADWHRYMSAVRTPLEEAQ